MNFFDRLVQEALAEDTNLHALRPVVEKELLHHDILREMSKGGFLKNLTFIGGTCLRACYASPRLSEDLDFAGGRDFQKEELKNLGDAVTGTLAEKYNVQVTVGEPQREEGDTKTWKIKVDTRPSEPHIASQRIHIDICMVSSFDRRPAMLTNRYRVDMGTSGLILYVESREEILADKLLAFAVRPNRVKYRDVWDIIWLSHNSVQLKQTLIPVKLKERRVEFDEFLHLLHSRISALEENHKEFLFEMRRFLPPQTVQETLENPEYWDIVLSVLRRYYSDIARIGAS